VMKNSGPVISSMNPMPINDELVTDVLEELWAVVEHGLSMAEHYYHFRWKNFLFFLARRIF